MRTTTRIVLASALIGAAVADGIGTANAQYYPPPPYGYDGGWRTWNGCPPGYTVEAAAAHPIKAPAEAGGVPGTAARRATRCRAATARPIKVRSAARADGMATEPSGRRLNTDSVCHRNFAAKFLASEVVPADLRATISMVAIESVIVSGIASH
jgi:hypothetical protein